VLWLPALLSSSCFDILDLTVSLVVLELLGPLETGLEIGDSVLIRELVNSVTELSCLTEAHEECFTLMRNVL
jgi:hypothetical protein